MSQRQIENATKPKGLARDLRMDNDSCALGCGMATDAQQTLAVRSICRPLIGSGSHYYGNGSTKTKGYQPPQLNGERKPELAKATYQRASDFVKGIGASLESIAGRDVLLHSFAISERAMRGETRTFVALDISPVNAPDDVTMYHAWSDSLAEKLNDIPTEQLPLIIKFQRVATSAGFRVWTFE